MLCKHEVIGSIPIGSTIALFRRSRKSAEQAADVSRSEYVESRITIRAYGAFDPSSFGKPAQNHLSQRALSFCSVVPLFGLAKELLHCEES